MEINSEEVDSVIQQLDDVLPGEVPVLTGKLIAKSTRIKGLIDSSSVGPVYMKRGEFSAYSSPGVLYIRSVRFYSPDPDILVKNLTVKPVGADGTPGKSFKLGRMTSSGYAYAFLDQFCRGFEVEIIGKKTLLTFTKIEITGYALDQLEAFAEDLRKGLEIRTGLDTYVEGLKSDIELAEDSKKEIDLRVSSTKGQLAELVGEVDKSEEQLAKSKERAVLITAALEKIREEARIAENAKQQIEGELKQLNLKMGETRHELKTLIQERRLISDEYSDFVLEGRKQSWWYAGLSVLPLAGAIAALVSLLVAGWNFAKLVSITPGQAYANLLQRAPYTIATVIAFTLLVKLCHVLLNRLIEIHGERLTLAKLLVVARDTAFASAADLDIDEDEIFRERMNLKMRLLKSHLGIDLDVTPSIDNAPLKNTIEVVDKGELTEDVAAKPK
ncbi:hypothetical protein LL967_05130 [Xanthomonas campestris pv. zinniae]|nr:hypothetical protein [Xanthomonas campestris pv. zinniae]